MSNPQDTPGPWYHGSPLHLAVLRAGSTVTRNRDLARVFSHRPAVVSMGDDGHLMHNGCVPGYLYVIPEEVGAADVVPHPRSAMRPGDEWLTTRELRLDLVGPVEPRPEELLSDAEVSSLMARLAGAEVGSSEPATGTSPSDSQDRRLPGPYGRPIG